MYIYTNYHQRYCYTAIKIMAMRFRFLSSLPFKGVVVFLLLSLACTLSYSQVDITFRIDLQALADSGFISKGDRVILRGSFNDWSGYAYELTLLDEDGQVCSKTFGFDRQLGDTLEYKYVILSSQGIEYWEHQPNPGNVPHGNRKVVIADTAMILPIASFDPGEDIKGRRLSTADMFRADFRQMQQLLQDNHPALYDYTSREVMDSLFEKYYGMIDTTTNYPIFYQYISNILAHVGCGHTKLFIPKAYWKSKPDCYFPLQLQIDPGRVMMKGSYANPSPIPPGSVVISVNGRTMVDILEEMLPLESADGFMESFKRYSIEKRFPDKYALLYGFPEKFAIQYVLPGQTQVRDTLLDASSREEARSIPMRGKELSMRSLEGHDAALITINTFGYYSEVPMFRAFIDSCFQAVKAGNIRNLIIDLRGNDGGDPFCASYLFSYLQKEPVPYFMDHYGKYDTLANPIPLPENHFTGKAYVIIDGGGFSTTGHLCGLLKYHRLVTFVGTELGSTYTCTGNVMYPTLNNTHLILGTARERRYSAAVRGMDPMRGVIPDHLVRTKQEDIINGQDAQLNYIMNLVQ
jgi:C-terminal processing protease CtpA/Prc